MPRGKERTLRWALAVVLATQISACGGGNNDPADISATRRTEQAGREQRIVELIAIVENRELAEANRKKVVEAILALGELGAAEGIPVLVEKLDFHISKSGIVKMGEIPPPEKVYPAVKALLMIGRPALPALTDAIAMANANRSETFLDNARYTIIRIAGSPEAGRAVLLDAAKEHKAGARRLEKQAARIPGRARIP